MSTMLESEPSLEDQLPATPLFPRISFQLLMQVNKERLRLHGKMEYLQSLLMEAQKPTLSKMTWGSQNNALLLKALHSLSRCSPNQASASWKQQHLTAQSVH